MRPQDVREAIKQHCTWLANKGGKRADISLAGLQNADLQGQILRHAKCTGTDFTRAKLQDVNFSESDLFGANFHFANSQARIWLAPIRAGQNCVQRI